MAQQKRGFHETIKHLNEGKLPEELDEAIREATAATRITGKQSEVILKLKISPVMKDDPSMVKVVEDVTTKLPKMERIQTSFHVTEENDLSRHHPGQLDIRNVLTEEDKPTRVLQ